MYAVIVTGGKQYRVTEGETLRVELLSADADSEIRFENVLMVGEGEQVKIGAPYVDGASVTAPAVHRSSDHRHHGLTDNGT